MDELDALLDDALDDMTAARRAPATDAGVGSSSSSSANPSLPPRGLGKAIFDPLAKPGKAGKKKPTRSAAAGAPALPNDEAAIAMEQMAQQLQALMGELGPGADGTTAGAGEAMRATLAAMANNGAAAAGGGGGGGFPAGLGGMGLPGMGRAFQGGLEGLGGDDIGEDLLSELTSSGEGMGLLETMMQQMLSKEVLYQPLVEMEGKYPAWLQANAATTSPEEMDRYRKQHGLVQQLLKVYEAAPEDYAQITALLQEMQECGQPPQELLAALAPGATFTDGMPGLPPEMAEQCCIA